MKKILFILLLLHLFTSGFFALATDYDQELKRSRKENKPAILYFFSRYCPYCEIMEKEVLLDKTVKKIIESDIVFIWIDGDVRKDLMKNYQVWGFPTFVLLEPSGKVIASIPGYVPKERFLKILEYLKAGHYRRVPLRRYLSEKKQ